MRRGFRRCVLFAAAVVLAAAFLLLPVAGEETGTALPIPGEYRDFLDTVPEDVRKGLPEGIDGEDGETVAGAVTELTDVSYLFRTVLNLVGLHLSDCAGLFACVMGILLLSAAARAVGTSLGQNASGKAFSFCASLCILLALLGEGIGSIRAAESYFSSLGKMTAGIIPLSGALYAMGGNVSAAVASSAGLSVYLTVLEETVGWSILPFCYVCLAFAAVSAMDPELRTGTLRATLKKNYTTLLAFLMMLLLALLAAQTTLGARSDTLAMRSVKFAAGNLIPVVGGSVSELLRSVSAGVGYLRGTVGICAVVLILLTLLPTLAELFLYRLTWQICASVADVLGCDNEKKLLEEFASLNGFLIAAVSICSSVCLLSLSLLIHCATAVG